MPLILESTIAQTFLERLRQTPGAIGFRYRSRNEWREVSFREFGQEAEEIALGLISLGFKPGDHAALISRTRFEWATADFGIIAARGVSVPIYPSITATEIESLLRHSDSKFAFVENLQLLESILPALPRLPGLQAIIVLDPESAAGLGSRARVHSLSELRNRGADLRREKPYVFEENLAATKPEDLLTLGYTSGTTGVPKGAMLTHRNLMSVLEDCEKAFRGHIRIGHEELLTFLPFSHIIGRVELMATFVFGWRLNFAESIDHLPELFREVRPTMIFAVPRIFEKAYAHIGMTLKSGTAVRRGLFNWAVKSGEKVYRQVWLGRRPGVLQRARYRFFREVILDRVSEGFGGRLRFAICGGAPLAREVGEYFQIVGIRILEGYGLTETFAPVALNTPSHLRFGTVGRPLPDVEVRIADDGEIYLKSAKIFQGYYKMPEETKAVFEDGWLKTGDIGFLDPDGFLHITDRKKDLLITSGGKNVAPQKIENLAKTLSPLIGEFVVIGDRKKYLTALITLNRPALQRFADEHHLLHSEAHELTRHKAVLGEVERLVTQLNSQLARFETIKKFMVLPGEFSVTSGELTPSLKIKRAFISRKFRSEIDQLYRDGEDLPGLNS